MIPFVLLTASNLDSIAIPVDTILSIQVSPYDSENADGISTGAIVWFLSVETASSAYTSPSVPTRDDAIMLLRHILETDDALIDLGACIGAWFGPAWGST